MKYSRATDYALHTMMFLVQVTPSETISVLKLAEKQQVSPSYLSKILTKLVKAGMVESMPGMNGGYKLKSNWKEVSFLDVIQAIEGTASLFDCSLDHGPDCPIQKVVVQAEEKMEAYLKSIKIANIVKNMQNDS